jgi:quercetin dioxygenase-like cupin family protein
MKIEHVPFNTTDWSKIDATEHLGEAGVARWRTIEQGNLRVRMIEYSPGYIADHWCERGHVIFVLSGELITELRDGRHFTLGPGMSYQVADGDGAHRSVSPKGALLFVVD